MVSNADSGSKPFYYFKEIENGHNYHVTKKCILIAIIALKFHEWSLNNFFFVKYKVESLVFKDQSTRIQTSFFEI